MSARGYRLPVGHCDPDGEITGRMLRSIAKAAKARGDRHTATLAIQAVRGDCAAIRELAPVIDATREIAAAEGRMGVLS